MICDWLRCYGYALVAFAWAALIHFHAISGDRFPWVAFLLSIGAAYATHIHRNHEKDREQDEELARLIRGDS
jgi:hypothetical protein